MADAPTEEAPKKKGKGLIIIVLVAVLLLGGGGAGAFVFLRGKGTSSASAHGEASKESKSTEGPEAQPGVLSLEAFITNLADSDGDRYIKCTMRLALDRYETAEKVKGSEISLTRIRDRILTLLSSKTYGQIASSEGKENLRKEIREQVDPLLDGGKVTDVYYSEFIVQ